MPTRARPGLKMISLKLSPADRARRDRIAAEVRRRTGTRLPAGTTAVRWALLELAAQLDGPGPGPVTPIPED